MHFNLEKKKHTTENKTKQKNEQKSQDKNINLR